MCLTQFSVLGFVHLIELTFRTVTQHTNDLIETERVQIYDAREWPHSDLVLNDVIDAGPA